MARKIRLEIADKAFTLQFNMIFGEQISRRLRLKDPTPAKIMEGLLAINEKSTFLMYKAIIYSAILGNDYVEGYEPTATEAEVAQLINECKPEQLEKLFNDLSQELGFNFKGKVEEGQTTAEPVKKKA